MAEVYEKRRKAAELRRLGNSWDDVAAGAGFSDKASAYKGVKALLKEHQSLAYDEIALYRQESLDRLTDLLRVAMTKALAGDEKMMREARLIISQIDDLTGAKAPVQVQIGESDVDRTIRELSAEIDRRAAAAAREAVGDQAPARPDSGD
jgi:hypothetical protein